MNEFSHWETWLQKWFIRLLAPALLINAGALFVTILEPDGALYALIAKTIARSGDFVNLRVGGHDWLDKPHFPFWMAALSMRLFGINEFGYKFPALLFWLLGAWYTYRLALVLYGRGVAQLGVLIYVSAAHLVISNNDVRAEPYLTGLVVGSIYHFFMASRGDRGWGHLVLGSLLAGCAMMTKGPFVLVTIGGGLVFDWLLRGESRRLLEPRWWAAVVLTLLFTAPELYCLYRQFDAHPEKVVFGRTGVSGVRFFFWDSQFGRFFNSGPIRGEGNFFFYFHTILWAFLPWSLLLYAAVAQKVVRWRRWVNGDLICLGAGLPSFLMFSLSKFQLPHYLNQLYPFFAILTAGWLIGVRRTRAKRWLSYIQTGIAVLLPLLLLGLAWLFHFRGWIVVMVLVLLSAAICFWGLRGRRPTAAVGRSFCMAMLVYAFINFWMYPGILQYQAGTQAGKWLAERASDRPIVYMAEEWPVNFSFQLYYPGAVERVYRDSIPRGAVLVFLPQVKADSMSHAGRRIESLQVFPDFHISQLTGEFVHYKTRGATLTPWALVRLYR